MVENASPKPKAQSDERFSRSARGEPRPGQVLSFTRSLTRPVPWSFDQLNSSMNVGDSS
jgi:hypothetical protein